MITRQLTDQEEVISDQLASAFYQNNSAPILGVVSDMLKNQSDEPKEQILEATLSRLYAEQTKRVEYFRSVLKLPRATRQEVENILLDESSPALFNLKDPTANEQLNYYRQLALNLAGYELQDWQKKNQLLFTLLIKLSPANLTLLRDRIAAFTHSFYENGEFKNFNQVSIPPALIELLEKFDIVSKLSNFDSVISQSAFLVFIQQICDFLIQAEQEGITNSDQLSSILATSTLNFKTTLTNEYAS